MTSVDPFLHAAVLYRGEQEYLTALVPFVTAGLAAGEPVAVAVPGLRLRPLRDELHRIEPGDGGTGTAADRVEWLDMTVAGRNPGRIIPGVLRAFADKHPAAGRVRIVGEPIWPGRSRVEYPACAQHEALINPAFTGRAVTILCPYDAAGLEPDALADAAATHPVMSEHGATWTSTAYDPGRIVEENNRPLDGGAARDTAVLRFGADDLLPARSFAAGHAARLGLPADRVPELEVAVNELVANSLVHGGGAGTLRLWAEHDRLVCQVHDRGHFTDPLAGRRPVGLGSEGGRGLLLVHHLADLVRVYTTPGGSTIRMYFALEARHAPTRPPTARAGLPGPARARHPVPMLPTLPDPYPDAIAPPDDVPA
jgi:anti-sigma regulatory factor (Ser/Thr protein kinase)